MLMYSLLNLLQSSVRSICGIYLSDRNYRKLLSNHINSMILSAHLLATGTNVAEVNCISNQKKIYTTQSESTW